MANLLVEETFFSLEEGVTNKTSPIKMSIYKRLGETRISLRLKGNSYNPLLLTVNESDDEIFSARQAILNANRDKILYTYKNGENIITIIVQQLSGKKKKVNLYSFGNVTRNFHRIFNANIFADRNNSINRFSCGYG